MSENESIIQYFTDANNMQNVVVGKLLFADVQEVTIPASHDGKMVTEIDPHAFSKTDISSIVLPETVIEIWDCAFDECRNLHEITITNNECRIHPAAFRNCVSLSKIILPSSMDYIWDSTFQGCHNLEEVVFPKNLKVIAEFAFLDCDRLKKVIIPDGTVEIKDCAFKGCNSLGLILIPASVKFIGDETFDGCRNFKIFGMPNSYAKEYAIRHKIPFYYLNSLVIGDTLLSQNELVHNISGNGWEWDAKNKLLRLTGYNGGAINRYGSDLNVELVSGTTNTLLPLDGKKTLYGLSSHGHSLTIGGGGTLIIDSVTEGIYATDSVYIKSGTITANGANHGVLARNNNVVITGGTLYAYASGNHEASQAVYGKIQMGNARLYVSKDNSTEPIPTDTYMRQKYACITYDETCTFEKARTVFSGCTFGSNAQVITGSVHGNVIGSDNIINRSTISDGGKSEIGNGNIINRLSSQPNDKEITSKKISCPNCGEEIEDADSAFCPECGYPLGGV